MKKKKQECSVASCRRTARCKTLCDVHYKRQLRYGDVGCVKRVFGKRAGYGEVAKWISNYLESLPSHNRCVEWPFSKNSKGYGHVKIEGSRRMAHRHVLSVVDNVDYNNEYVCAHSYHNPSCVNPIHLRWATGTENQHDRRENLTNGKKLADAEVLDIYASNEKQQNLAESYGISRSSVRDIKTGRCWAWLTGHEFRKGSTGV